MSMPAADLSALAALARDEELTFVLSVYIGEYRYDWRGDNRVWVYARFDLPDHATGEPIAQGYAQGDELKPGRVNTAMIERVGLEGVKSTQQ